MPPSTDRWSGGRARVAPLLDGWRLAELIVVLDQGTIVEQGTHEALLAQEGLYATMFREQASAYT